MKMEDSVKILIEICHRLYVKGFVTAMDGNVSVRLENGNFLTTRSSVNKGMITVEDLVEVNQEGAPLTSHLKPSTELGMHLYIYSQRPDVKAIVHAHPIYSTGFAVARQPLTSCVFPEVIVGLGAIPLAEYATPSTREVAESLSPFVMKTDAILLANHGVVTYGKDLYDAYFKMEKVEHAAHIMFVARMLGGEHRLTPEDIDKLKAISIESYGKDLDGKLSCETGSSENSDSNKTPSDEEIRELVRQMIQGKS